MVSRLQGGHSVLHLVMLSEVETSFSSRARRTRHAVSLRWVLVRTPSAALVPLPKAGQFNHVHDNTLPAGRVRVGLLPTGEGLGGAISQSPSCISSSIARHNWSGHDVGLPLQLMPLRRAIISSYFMPVTRRLMPCRLPLQPP